MKVKISPILYGQLNFKELETNKSIGFYRKKTNMSSHRNEI